MSFWLENYTAVNSLQLRNSLITFFFFFCGDLKYTMVIPLWCKSVMYITRVWLTIVNILQKEIFLPIPALFVLSLSIGFIVHIKWPALCLIYSQVKRNFNAELKQRTSSFWSRYTFLHMFAGRSLLNQIRTGIWCYLVAYSFRSQRSTSRSLWGLQPHLESWLCLVPVPEKIKLLCSALGKGQRFILPIAWWT